MSEVEEPLIRAIVLVDHGSKRDSANELLNRICCSINKALGAPACTHCPNSELTDEFATPVPPELSEGFAFCEVAHMELAPPEIPAAISACVQRGAREIVVVPYFLSPGRHSQEDIPRMAEEAGAVHADIPGGIQVRVAQPLGFDSRLVALALERAAETSPQ